jgi:hypothetical protein
MIAGPPLSPSDFSWPRHITSQQAGDGMPGALAMRAGSAAHVARPSRPARSTDASGPRCVTGRNEWSGLNEEAPDHPMGPLSPPGSRPISPPDWRPEQR